MNQPSNVQSQTRTLFPPDPAIRSISGLLYILSNTRVSGMPVTRWITGLLFLIAILTGVGWFPGGWIAAFPLVAAAVCMIVVTALLRRKDYVRFEEGHLPAVAPMDLDPIDKIQVHASGAFSVEGKHRRFTWLPGFYRTFATREHALLCLAREKRALGIARWPMEDLGMWYIFFTPELIHRIRWGVIHFGGNQLPGIVVTYLLTVPPRNRFAREKIREEHVYIACTNEQGARQILADLLVNRTVARTPPAV